MTCIIPIYRRVSTTRSQDPSVPLVQSLLDLLEQYAIKIMLTEDTRLQQPKYKTNEQVQINAPPPPAASYSVDTAQ